MIRLTNKRIAFGSVSNVFLFMMLTIVQAAGRASSWQPNLSSSVRHSGVSTITEGIANVALSSDQQRESRASYSAEVLESDQAWREEAAAAVTGSQANLQGPEALVGAADMGQETQPSVKTEVTFFVHPFSVSPTAQAKIDLEATRLDSIGEAWGRKEGDPESEDKFNWAMYKRFMELDKVYMAAGVRSGFPVARIIHTESRHPDDPDQNPRVVDNSGFLARQYLNPAPDNNETANSMPVLMIKKGAVDEDASSVDPLRATRKLPDVKLAPAHDVQAHMGDGWSPFVQDVPDECGSPRGVNGLSE